MLLIVSTPSSTLYNVMWYFAHKLLVQVANDILHGNKVLLVWHDHWLSNLWFEDLDRGLLSISNNGLQLTSFATMQEAYVKTLRRKKHINIPRDDLSFYCKPTKILYWSSTFNCNKIENCIGITSQWTVTIKEKILN